MPVEYTGFTLKPFGFFDANPAINLAPSAGAGGRHCHPQG
jgi:primary-amine oxidase